MEDNTEDITLEDITTEKKIKPGILNYIFAVLICLIIVACIFLSSGYAEQTEAKIIINEVVSSNSNSLGDASLGTPDWIELYNPTGQDMDLSGLMLTDKSNAEGSAFDGVTIPANGYLIVYAEKDGVIKDACCVDFGISRNGETIYLLNSNNVIVDQLEVPALLTDFSYARRSDGTFGYCGNTTPGACNGDANIMDTGQLDVFLQMGDLVITEVLPRAADGYGWVELMNKGETDVMLGNYSLSDSAGDAYKWRLPEITLKAGEYEVVYLSGLDEYGEVLHTSFRLGTDETGVYLFDIEGNLKSSLEWAEELPWGIAVLEDGPYTAFPTMGAENSVQTFEEVSFAKMDTSDPVRISEVLPCNKYSITDSDGDREEWVELHNSSDATVYLSGYFLSDDRDNPFKWGFPDGGLKAGEYVIVFISGKTSKEGELHASFGLSEGETGIYLTCIDGLKMDSLTLPEDMGANISTGRDENGDQVFYAQPTPGSANAVAFEDLSLICSFNPEGVYISEVCSANKAKSDNNDWIELHNGSDEAIDLTGYCLSDNSDETNAWTIPSLCIEAGGYSVIEASASLEQCDEDTATFGISPSGETLLLRDAQGEFIDSFSTGVLSTGTTSGRVEEDSTLGRVFFTEPTRGGENSDEYYTGYAAMPVISESGLYHTEEFTLNVNCTTPEAKIYYTTDGSVPTDKSKEYTGPLTIASNTAIRTVAYADGLLPSEINTATFIFDDPHTLPVFCISGKPSEIRCLLNSDSIAKPEYAVNVEYYEKNGSLGVEFPSGLRPKGKSSLSLPQNSLTIALRSDYGQKSVTYPFFSDSSISTYSTLALRSSGQDSVNAKIRDSFVQEISKGLNLDSIDTKPVVVYMNGSYCGLYDLVEDQNEDYIESYYGVESDNLDIISRGRKILAGSIDEYKNVCSMARTWDLSDDEVFAEFAKYVDVDACTDYLVTQIYFGNGDVVNQKFWRACDYSVKWRPLLFDLDFCLRANNVNRNVFGRYLIERPSIGGYDKEGNALTAEMYIFCGLKKNAAWREKFVERFVELAVTKFSTENVLKLFDEMVAEREPEMQMHIDRWHTPRNMSYWQGQISKLRSALEKRQEVVFKQLKSYFRVSDETLQKYIDKYSPQA